MIGDIIVYGATLSALWMLVACGFTLMYGVTEIVNMAYGVSYALAAYIMYLAALWIGVPPLLSMIIALFVSLAISMAIYQFIIRPVMHSHELTITVTFIILLVATEVFRIIFGPEPHHVPMLIRGSVSVFGIPVMLQRLSILPISLATLLCLRIFLHKTTTGRAIRAVAQDREAALLMGINVQRMFLISMVISTLLCALAGCLAVPLEVVDPMTAWSPVVPIFAVTILGGLGNIEGAIVAAIVLGYSEVIVASVFGSQFRGIVPLIATLLILQIRPEGLLGRRGRS